MPQLVVVVVEALPVLLELLQAVGVDVLDPGGSVSDLPTDPNSHRIVSGSNIHAPRASSDPTTLLEAFELSPARVLRLALHVVIVVVAAPGADEVGGGIERRRGDAELLDLGDRLGEGSGVDQLRLVEARGRR